MSPFGYGLVLSVFIALTVSAVQSDENGMYCTFQVFVNTIH